MRVYVVECDPAKIKREERYLTDWEIRMREEIEQRISEDIHNDIENAKKNGLISRLNNTYAQERYREEKREEYETAYRINHTLNILKKAGLDLEEFGKTWMWKCDRAPLVLKCIQDYIDGFEYDYDGEREPYYAGPMDLNKLECELEEDVIRVRDDKRECELDVDENQIIRVGMENVLRLDPIPTENEQNKAIKELITNIKTDIGRIRR